MKSTKGVFIVLSSAGKIVNVSEKPLNEDIILDYIEYEEEHEETDVEASIREEILAELNDPANAGVVTLCYDEIPF